MARSGARLRCPGHSRKAPCFLRSQPSEMGPSNAKSTTKTRRRRILVFVCFVRVRKPCQTLLLEPCLELSIDVARDGDQFDGQGIRYLASKRTVLASQYGCYFT